MTSENKKCKKVYPKPLFNSYDYANMFKLPNENKMRYETQLNKLNDWKLYYKGQVSKLNAHLSKLEKWQTKNILKKK